jgi:hypothetical protein
MGLCFVWVMGVRWVLKKFFVVKVLVFWLRFGVCCWFCMVRWGWFGVVLWCVSTLFVVRFCMACGAHQCL